MSEDLLSLVDRVVADARGGEGVEAFAVDETETTVKAYEGEVEELSSARTRGIGIRVIDDGRVGYAYSADLGDEALRSTLESARANAAVSTPDEANVLPAAGGFDDLPGLYDEAVEAIRPEQKVAIALRLEAAARAAGPPIRGVDTARYGDAVTVAAIASTAGIAATYRRCDAYVLVEALAEADGATASAYGLDIARRPDDLEVERAAEEATQRAARLAGGRKPPSGRMPVVLDQFATAAYLGVLAAGLSAEAVQRGRSLFADKVGERLGGEHVSLIDDGRLMVGPAAAPWDGEGVATGRTSLIERGVLTGFLHNTYTGAKDGVASTGNAQRAGYRSPPGLSPTNLFLEPGDLDQAALLAQVGEGFYCQQILGAHSGANPISGDFSVGAAGLMIRDGALAEPVREATIASTIPEMLSGLAAVGSDLRFLPFGGGMGGVTLVVDGMTLAGA